MSTRWGPWSSWAGLGKDGQGVEREYRQRKRILRGGIEEVKLQFRRRRAGRRS